MKIKKQKRKRFYGVSVLAERIAQELAYNNPALYNDLNQLNTPQYGNQENRPGQK